MAHTSRTRSLRAALSAVMSLAIGLLPSQFLKVGFLARVEVAGVQAGDVVGVLLGALVGPVEAGIGFPAPFSSGPRVLVSEFIAGALKPISYFLRGDAGQVVIVGLKRCPEVDAGIGFFPTSKIRLCQMNNFSIEGVNFFYFLLTLLLLLLICAAPAPLAAPPSSCEH